MDVSEAGSPVPSRTTGDDGTREGARPRPRAPSGPDPIRHRLVEVSGGVEPLFDRWAVERGRPRHRTLRRVLHTVELLARIDEELLLPALAGAPRAAGAVPRLAAGVEALRDTMARMMRGATGRRQTPMGDLRRAQAAHRADVDAWLAVAADGLSAEQWAALAEAVDARIAPWIGGLQADAGPDDPPA